MWEKENYTEEHKYYFGYIYDVLQERLNKTELGIIELILSQELMISQIADTLEKSLSWTSECVRHLTEMQILEKHKEGVKVWVRPAPNELVENLQVLMKEGPILNLSSVLINSGLTILPLLQEPGATLREIHIWTSLSYPTIRSSMKRWRSMGVVVFNKKTKHFYMNPSQRNLRTFLTHYSISRNNRYLRSLVPGAVIVWQWRDEFLFSSENEMAIKEFLNAGPTVLDELRYDIISIRDYYFHSPGLKKVSEEEALVQTLWIDPHNPRTVRNIEFALNNRKINPQRLLDFAKKYGLKTRMMKVVNRYG